MPSSRLLDLAHAVLQKSGTVTWDTRGTVPGQVSLGTKPLGTAETELNQAVNPTVPLSQPLGRGTLGHPQKPGTVIWDTRGTPARYVRVFGVLLAGCPAHISPIDWQQAVEDGRKFFASWGEQADALGWTSNDLFSLAPVPDSPSANYRRLSRHDLTGLIWMLRARPVIALTETTAAIQSATAILTYHKREPFR